MWLSVKREPSTRVRANTGVYVMDNSDNKSQITMAAPRPKHRHRRHNGHKQGQKWPPKEFMRCPVVAVTFTKGSRGPVSFLNNGEETDIISYPFSAQFNPEVDTGKEYNCYVLTMQDSQGRPYFRLCPATDPYVLSLEEWLDAKTMCRTERLTFRTEPTPNGKGEPRPFARS